MIPLDAPATKDMHEIRKAEVHSRRSAGRSVDSEGYYRFSKERYSVFMERRNANGGGPWLTKLVSRRRTDSSSRRPHLQLGENAKNIIPSSSAIGFARAWNITSDDPWPDAPSPPSWFPKAPLNLDCIHEQQLRSLSPDKS